MTNLLQVYRILNEYDNSKSGVTLAAPGGDKASGKSYDHMATGESQPYKNSDYQTKYQKLYPHLGQIVDRLKNSALPGDIVLVGPALQELQQLLSAYKPKVSDYNEIILPFGDNIRLKAKGNKFFIGISQEKLQGTDKSIGRVTTL